MKRTVIDGDEYAFKVRREEMIFDVPVPEEWRTPRQAWVLLEREHTVIRRIGSHVPLNMNAEGTGPHFHFTRRIEPVNAE